MYWALPAAAHLECWYFLKVPSCPVLCTEELFGAFSVLCHVFPPACSSVVSISSLLWCPFPGLMSANNFIKIFVAWLWCLYSISYVKWSYWEPRQFSNLMSCPYTTKTFTSSTSVTFGTSFIHSAVNPLVWNVFVLFCCLFSCGTVLAAALQWNSASAQYQGADKCCSMSQTQLEVPGTGGCGSAAWLQ